MTLSIAPLIYSLARLALHQKKTLATTASADFWFRLHVGLSTIKPDLPR